MRWEDLDHDSHIQLDETLRAVRRACERHRLTVAELAAECERISAFEGDGLLWHQGRGALGALAAWLADDAPRRIRSQADGLRMWRWQQAAEEGDDA